MKSKAPKRRLSLERRASRTAELARHDADFGEQRILRELKAVQRLEREQCASDCDAHAGTCDPKDDQGALCMAGGARVCCEDPQP